MSSAHNTVPAVTRPKWSVATGNKQVALIALMVLMEIGFASVQPRVVSSANLLNVLHQASYLVVLTVAQTLVILTRGFDLSLGTTVSAVSVASALVLTGFGDSPTGWTLLLGIVVGLGLGLAVGVFNGLLVAYIGVNPFIATLASLNICLGIATTISNGGPVFGVPDSFSVLLNDGKIFGTRVPLLIAICLPVAAWFMLDRTVFGRALLLIGANPRAAFVAGLPVRRYLAGAYALCSLLAALGGLMLTARTGSGEPNLGGSLMLQSIAAAVIGGTSLRGGSGGIGAAVLGALFVTMLSNGMDLAQVSGYMQMIALGVVVVFATALDFQQAARRA